jgi:hypothetical protein
MLMLSGVCKLTVLVGLVALSCNAAGYCLDETRVGADAFGVEVAGTRDRVEGAVLLRGDDNQQCFSMPSSCSATQNASDGVGKLTAHRGKELKLCAEANAARRAVTTTVRGDMASS